MIYRLKLEISIWLERTSEFTNTIIMYLSKNLPVVNRIKSFLSHVCLFSSQWMQKVVQRNDQLLRGLTVLKAKHRLNPIKSPASNLPLKELHGNMTPGVPSYQNHFSPPLANTSPRNLSLLLSLITDWRRFTQQHHFPPVSSLSSYLINPFTGNKNLPLELTTFPVHYLLINLNCSTPDR